MQIQQKLIETFLGSVSIFTDLNVYVPQKYS